MGLPDSGMIDAPRRTFCCCTEDSEEQLPKFSISDDERAVQVGQQNLAHQHDNLGPLYTQDNTDGRPMFEAINHTGRLGCSEPLTSIDSSGFNQAATDLNDSILGLEVNTVHDGLIFRWQAVRPQGQFIHLWLDKCHRSDGFTTDACGFQIKTFCCNFRGADSQTTACCHSASNSFAQYLSNATSLNILPTSELRMAFTTAEMSSARAPRYRGGIIQ
eukprot:1848027-Amphidinium_carterae.1